jgi:sugar phosphate permease
MGFTYFLQSYDKGILSASTQFGILTDLDLQVVIGHTKAGKAITNNKRFSNCSFIFYIGYLIGTYPMSESIRPQCYFLTDLTPSVFLSQRYGPSRVLGISTFLWGAVVMSTAGVKNYTGMMFNRIFLGILESAVAPGFTVLVTFWWTRQEQALRTSAWYSCVGLSTVINPFMNYGLGHIHSHLKAWQPLFLILGAITMSWSVVILLFLPDNPHTSKFLTEEERAIAVSRLERNRAGDIHHDIEWAQVREGLTDWKIWSSAVIILLTGVPSGALGTFGTLVFHSFGYDAFHSLAFTSAVGAITFSSIIVAGLLTRRVPNIRYIMIAAFAIISIAGTLICWIQGPTASKNALLGGVLLIAVQVASGGIAVSLAASNTGGHTSESFMSCPVAQ